MNAVSDQHIVQQPRFVFFIKIAQIALAVLILGLTAFSVSKVAIIDGAFGFNIFCCIYTFIMCAYLMITPLKMPHLWNCWAVLALEACGAIFWLCAFATMASFASATAWITKLDSTYSGSSSTFFKKREDTTIQFGDYSASYSDEDTTYDDSYSTSSLESSWKTVVAAYKCAAAVAGLGSLIWILFMVSFVVYAMALWRHRKNPENANLPSDGSPATHEIKTGHEMQSTGDAV